MEGMTGISDLAAQPGTGICAIGFAWMDGIVDEHNGLVAVELSGIEHAVAVHDEELQRLAHIREPHFNQCGLLRLAVQLAIEGNSFFPRKGFVICK